MKSVTVLHVSHPRIIFPFSRLREAFLTVKQRLEEMKVEVLAAKAVWKARNRPSVQQPGPTGPALQGYGPGRCQNGLAPSPYMQHPQTFGPSFIRVPIRAQRTTVKSADEGRAAFSLTKSLVEFLSLVTRIHDLEEFFDHAHGAWYESAEIPEAVITQRPILMDPVNPYHNLLDLQDEDAKEELFRLVERDESHEDFRKDFRVDLQ